MAGQRCGEIVAGFGPSAEPAPFSAGPFTAPSACEGDLDRESRSQGVAPASEYAGSKMLWPRRASGSAVPALQSLAQPLPGCQRRVAAVLGRAAGQAEPSLPAVPGAEPLPGCCTPGAQRAPPSSSLVSPERVPHGDGLPQRGQHLVPVRDAHAAGRWADEDVPCVVGAAVLAPLGHRHPQGQVLLEGMMPSQGSSTAGTDPYTHVSPHPPQSDGHEQTSPPV